MYDIIENSEEITTIIATITQIIEENERNKLAKEVEIYLSPIPFQNPKYTQKNGMGKGTSKAITMDNTIQFIYILIKELPIELRVWT